MTAITITEARDTLMGAALDLYNRNAEAIVGLMCLALVLYAGTRRWRGIS